jgi:hypothetical protein
MKKKTKKKVGANSKRVRSIKKNYLAIATDLISAEQRKDWSRIKEIAFVLTLMS